MPRVKQFDEEEVLQKAVDLFWRKGYHATSIQDLVTELGINRASIYHTYGDKRQLFDRAFESYRSNSLSWVKKFLVQQPSVKEGFQALFTLAIKESISDPDAKGCFVINCITEFTPEETDLMAILKEHNLGLIDFFASYIQTGVDSGELSQDKDVYGIASTLFTLYNGLRVVTKVSREKAAMVAMVNTALTLFD